MNESGKISDGGKECTSATEAIITIVAEILAPDPYDDRAGPFFSQSDLKRLAALPAGTKLYVQTSGGDF